VRLITCDVVFARVKDCNVSAIDLFRFGIESLLNALPGRAAERAALKTLILVNRYDYTTCGWATNE
jgi:hypothetical protein